MKKIVFIGSMLFLLAACKTSASSTSSTKSTQNTTTTAAESEAAQDAENSEEPQEVKDPKGVTTMSPNTKPSVPVKKYPSSGN